MKTRLLEQRSFYYALFAVLLVPALLINLGSHNLFVHTDESRRALVALEMILSGDYITPTLNGEFYYNKPPLYNWVIAISFKIFGTYSAFALRFPVVIAVVLYATLIVYSLREILGLNKAALVAIATITSGRILFYDSFLGLIDIAFSAIIFANFMIFYHLILKKKYFLFFSLSYFLMAVAYLMKGLPPLVFQFFTLLAWLVYSREWKRVFSPAHLLSVFFFVIPVGLYYFFYLKINDHSIQTLVETLWSESSKRTVAEHGILESLKAMVKFPLENLYHFAPWTILVAALFHKGIFKKLWSGDFTRFVILAFGLNIIVYWTSPEVYPRYLFMFVPLLMILLFTAFDLRSRRFQKIIENIVFGVLILACTAPIIVHFAGRTAHDGAYFVKLVVVGVSLIAITTLYYRKPDFRWIILGCFLLALRIGFNWFALPERSPKGKEYQAQAEEIAKITEGQPLFIHRTYLHDGSSFIISSRRNEILRKKDVIDQPAYYIVYEERALDKGYDIVYTFGTMTNDEKLALILIR